jgi:hypothetical protein
MTAPVQISARMSKTSPTASMAMPETRHETITTGTNLPRPGRLRAPATRFLRSAGTWHAARARARRGSAFASWCSISLRIRCSLPDKDMRITPHPGVGSRKLQRMAPCLPSRNRLGTISGQLPAFHRRAPSPLFPTLQGQAAADNSDARRSALNVAIRWAHEHHALSRYPACTSRMPPEPVFDDSGSPGTSGGLHRSVIRTATISGGSRCPDVCRLPGGGGACRNRANANGPCKTGEGAPALLGIARLRAPEAAAAERMRAKFPTAERVAS